MTAVPARRPHPHRRQCPVAPQAHPLARRLFELIDGQGAALTTVAERAGLAVATLVKWKYRHAPTVTALEAALNVLGYELRIVPVRGRDGRAGPRGRNETVAHDNLECGG